MIFLTAKLLAASPVSSNLPQENTTEMIYTSHGQPSQTQTLLFFQNKKYKKLSLNGHLVYKTDTSIKWTPGVGPHEPCESCESPVFRSSITLPRVDIIFIQSLSSALSPSAYLQNIFVSQGLML